MKIIIRRSGEEMPYEIINNAVSIKENEHCIIVDTKKNRLMYSKPEFEISLGERTLNCPIVFIPLF